MLAKQPCWMTAISTAAGFISPTLKKVEKNGLPPAKFQPLKSWPNVRRYRSFSVYPLLVSSVAFSPDGKSLICGHFLMSSGAGSTIKIWDLHTKALLHSLSSHLQSVSSVAATTEGFWDVQMTSPTEADATPLLVSGSYDGTLKLWDLPTGKLLQTFCGHSDAVHTLSVNRQLLASGSYDRTIQLWDLKTGLLLHTLSGHTAAIGSVALSPVDAVVASGSHDHTVKIWHCESGELQLTFQEHTAPVKAIAFSPDGGMLTSASQEGTVKLWDVKTGTVKQSLSGRSAVLSVAYSLDGQVLATGSEDGAIKLWCVATGKLLRTLGRGWAWGRAKWPTSVVFSPDGRTLAAGYSDGTVQVWQI